MYWILQELISRNENVCASVEVPVDFLSKVDFTNTFCTTVSGLRRKEGSIVSAESMLSNMNDECQVMYKLMCVS